MDLSERSRNCTQKKVWSGVSALDLYLRGAQFESRPGTAILRYEGQSTENLKSAIKIRNTARLCCKMTTML